jgi:hypothetical protein
VVALVFCANYFPERFGTKAKDTIIPGIVHIAGLSARAGRNQSSDGGSMMSRRGQVKPGMTSSPSSTPSGPSNVAVPSDR